MPKPARNPARANRKPSAAAIRTPLGAKLPNFKSLARPAGIATNQIKNAAPKVKIDKDTHLGTTILRASIMAATMRNAIKTP